MSWKGESQRHSMSSRGIQTRMKVVSTKPRRVEVEEGSKIIVERGLPIPHRYTRYKEPTDFVETLHSGKFIVEWCDEYQCHLADADWDEDGRITFHSSKHGHLIQIEDLEKLTLFKAGGIPSAKPFIGAKVDFCRKPDLDDAKFSRPVPLLTPPPVVTVPQKTYDQIEDTDGELPAYVLKNVGKFKTGTKANPSYHTGAVITDGQRFLVIDTQGYKYPRYKSRVHPEGAKKALRWS